MKKFLNFFLHKPDDRSRWQHWKKVAFSILSKIWEIHENDMEGEFFMVIHVKYDHMMDSCAWCAEISWLCEKGQNWQNCPSVETSEIHFNCQVSPAVISTWMIRLKIQKMLLDAWWTYNKNQVLDHRFIMDDMKIKIKWDRKMEFSVCTPRQLFFGVLVDW